MCASASFLASTAFAQDFTRQTSAGTSKENAPELVSGPETELLWAVGNTGQHYVKVSGGDPTKYQALYVSGGAGENHDAIFVLENGATLELSKDTVTYNNTQSKAWLTYAFETLKDTDTATVKLTNTSSSSFSLSYDSEGKPFPDDGKRGVSVGKGITLQSAGDIMVTDNTVNAGGDFTLNGTMIAGENGTKSVTITDARFTQNAGALLKATSVSIENTTDTVKRNATFGGELVTDKLVLKNAKATLSTFNALTADQKANIELNGGTVELATTSATVLASANITEAKNTTSTLNIANNMTIGKIIAPKSKLYVDTGIKLTVGDSTENNYFNIGGTIKGTVEIYSKKTSDSTNNFIESNMIIDGGTLQEMNGNNTSYNLTAKNATITVRNGGVIAMSNGYLGIDDGGKYVFEDAASKINTHKISMKNGATLQLASANNIYENTSLLVRDTNAAVSKLILTKDTNAYKFSELSILRTVNLTIDLNGASIEIGKIGRYNTNASTLNLVFEDFANGLVKFNGTVNDDGKIVGDDSLTAIISGTGIKNGQLLTLTSGWNVVDGYLYNSQLAIPEPAEWAAILGAIALAFAAYRRRK